MEEVVEAELVTEALDLCLVDGPLDAGEVAVGGRGGGGDGGEVDDWWGDGVYRDAVVEGSLVGRDHRSVEDDSRPGPALPRNRDLRTPFAPSDAPSGAGRPVSQQRTLPSGQHRRHP